MALSQKDREYLLALARETIELVIHGQSPPAVDLDNLSQDLQRPGACFVTLTLGGQLRGCIGSIEPRRPLALDVQENAMGAALRDPRFPPLSKEELAVARIEISALTPPEPLDYYGPEDLLAKLRPHVDGVIIQRGWQRATFLPQVWEKLPTPQEFLGSLCMKAGLPPSDYTRPGLEVLTYQVEKFEESEIDD